MPLHVCLSQHHLPVPSTWRESVRHETTHTDRHAWPKSGHHEPFVTARLSINHTAAHRTKGRHMFSSDSRLKVSSRSSRPIQLLIQHNSNPPALLHRPAPPSLSMPHIGASDSRARSHAQPSNSQLYSPSFTRCYTLLSLKSLTLIQHRAISPSRTSSLGPNQCWYAKRRSVWRAGHSA